MARKASIDETALTRMEIRKLNMLRTSIGDELGTRTFLQWLRDKPALGVQGRPDKTAAAIAEAVERLIAERRIKSIPRGGYVLKRGRGRVRIEPAAAR